jgi:hypothetical protein
MVRHRVAVVRINSRLMEFIGARLMYDEEGPRNVWNVALEGVTDGKLIIDALAKGSSLNIDVTASDGHAYTGEASVAELQRFLRKRYYCDAKLTGSGPLRRV